MHEMLVMPSGQEATTPSKSTNANGASLSFSTKRFKIKCVPWGEDNVTIGAQTLSFKFTRGPCHTRGCLGNAGSSSLSADQVDLPASKLTCVHLGYSEVSRHTLATGIGQIAAVLIACFYARDGIGLDGWESSDFRKFGLVACAAYWAVWYFFMRSTCAVSRALRRPHLRCSAQAELLIFAGIRDGRSQRHKDK